MPMHRRTKFYALGGSAQQGRQLIPTGKSVRTTRATAAIHRLIYKMLELTTDLTVNPLVIAAYHSARDFCGLSATDSPTALRFAAKSEAEFGSGPLTSLMRCPVTKICEAIRGGREI